MKYAVIYQSKSGNTKRLAETIYQAIDSKDKVLCDLNQKSYLPKAEIYFVGFGIHNQSCSVEIMDLLETLEGKRYALFMSCGLKPTEKYKETLKKKLEVWFPEDGELLDMIVCQGRVEDEQKERMYSQMPSYVDEMKIMFEEGDNHPDNNDLRTARNFAIKIQEKEEHRIPIW